MMELFDEENAYTALADQWENYGTLNYIEDERRESLADSEVERSEPDIHDDTQDTYRTGN